MVPLSMTLSGLRPTFQGHDNIQRQITRLIVSRVWSTQWFRFQWPCPATVCRPIARRVVSAYSSVTFVYCTATSKQYSQNFSPSGIATIRFFPYKMLWQYSDGDPLTGGVEIECWWVWKNVTNRFMLEMIQGCAMWNANFIYRMVAFSMTLSDP